MKKPRILILAVLLVGLVLGAGPAPAAPKAELWARWTAHDPASTTTVDHAAWDRFLKTYVDDDPAGLNRVAYADVTNADRAALAAYLQTLSETPVSALGRDEQMAYWINLYNALTVRVILDHYPVESIRDIDISPGLFANGPWGKKLIRVEGEELSLDDIEHRILRPIWRDPRIHYAVNCAAVGCPDLMARAYAPATLDRDLAANGVAYVNDPRGVRVIDGDLIVSSIFDWFQEDFGDDEAGVIEHLRQYAAGETKTALEGRTGIDDYAYDWALNDTR